MEMKWSGASEETFACNMPKIDYRVGDEKALIDGLKHFFQNVKVSHLTS